MRHLRNSIILSHGIFISTQNDFYGTNLSGSAIELAKQSEVESLKSSVSSGKQQVANAITGKGVSASGNDSFATLANKINQIPSSPYQNPDYVNQVMEKTTYNPCGISVANHDSFQLISAPPMRYTYNGRLYDQIRLRAMAGNTDYNYLQWENSSGDYALQYSLSASYNRDTNILTWTGHSNTSCFVNTEMTLLSDGRIRITLNLQNSGYYSFEGELKAVIESRQTSFALLTKVSNFYGESSIYLSYSGVNLITS